jgi:hypothetical protein
VIQSNVPCGFAYVLCTGNLRLGDDLEVGKCKLELAYMSYPTITQSVRRSCKLVYFLFPLTWGHLPFESVSSNEA